MISYEERVTYGQRLCKADGQNKELPVDIDSMSWMAHNVEKIVRAKSSDEKKSDIVKYEIRCDGGIATAMVRALKVYIPVSGKGGDIGQFGGVLCMGDRDGTNNVTVEHLCITRD